MQNKESTKFQLNSQVVIVLGVTMIALTLPILTVILAFKLPSRSPEKPPEISTAPMQQALEDVATKQLANPALSASDHAIQYRSADLASESARLDRLAQAAGGFALADPVQDNSQRVLANIPADRVQEFVVAAQSKASALTTREKGTQPTELIEITVQRE